MLVMLQLRVRKGGNGYHLTGQTARYSLTDSHSYNAATIRDCLDIVENRLVLSEAREADDREAAKSAKVRLEGYRPR